MPILRTEASFTRSVSERAIEFSVLGSRQTLLVMIPVSAFFVYASMYAMVDQSEDLSVRMIAALLLLSPVVIGFWIRSRRRIPVVLRITSSGLHTARRTFPLNDIAELQLAGKGEMARSAGGSTLTVGGTGASGFALAAGAGMANAAHNTAQNALVSYVNALNSAEGELRIRQKSHSKPVTLVKHLTPETGEALLQDLVRDLQQASEGLFAG